MLFVDSSGPSEVAEVFAWGAIAGVTTNPLLFAKQSGGADFEARIREILAVSRGPVSVEVVGEREEDMLAEARSYHAWDASRVVVKVPLTEPGLRVIARLAAEGIATNATCLMNFAQAYVCALAGATYVSIFSGRVRDMGYDVRTVIADTRRQLDRERLPSKLIVGSVRQPIDVTESLSAGADVVTVTPTVLRALLKNPRTDETIREFSEAWSTRHKGP